MVIKINYTSSDIYVSTNVSPVYVVVNYSGASAAGNFVPYTGATANVDLGEFELKAGQLTLDTSPTGTAAVGTTRWNDTIGSSETTLKGGSVILKNGVDLVARVVNKVSPNTTLTKAAYQAVKISGAQGQRLAISLAQANNDAGSADTIGLVTETINANQEGFIMTVGNLEGINTTGSLQGETWADGDVLYLSPTTAGAITNVKPNGSTGHIVVVGYVEYAHQNNGKIYVKVMNGWELSELHDVFIDTPLNDQVLTYESATSLWKNKTPTGGGGTTIYTGDGTLAGNRTVTMGAFTLSFEKDVVVNGNRLGRGNSNDLRTVVFGQLAGVTTTTAQQNVFIGYSAGNLVTTANSNVLVGAFAGRIIDTGGANTIIGHVSGYTLTTGTYNTLIGRQAGNGITTGIHNTIVGPIQSGSVGITTGSYNTIVGSQVTALPSALSNNIILADGQGNIRIRAWDTGNVTINSTTDPGEKLYVNGTARVTGNLSINNATAFGWQSGFKVIEMQGGASIASFTATPSAQILTNLYNDGLGLVRISATFGTRYYQLSGQHVFEVTGSGSAGSSATMNTAMTLTNAGRLLLGTVSEATYLLDVNGTARVSGQLRLGTTSNFANITGINIISNNSYFDGSNVSRYITSNPVSIFLQQVDGSLQFQQAPTGSADSAITFSTKFEILANGRLVTGGAGDYGALVNMLGTTSDALQIGNANYLKIGGQASGTQYIKAFETDFTIGNAFSGGSLILMSGNANRVTIKSNGSVNYTPMATPGTASAGDVYYDSTSNKLRCYNGTSWNDLF
jgi:nitrogen fixation protein